MKPSLIAGAVLAALVLLITVILAVTGLHTRAGTQSWFVPVAVGVQVAVLLGMFRVTARNNGCGGQG